jgi:hypothetical protein
MALAPLEMIDILDRYGFTGIPAETEYPSGTEGWDSYSIPWPEVLNQDRTPDDTPEADVADVSGGALGRWSGAGRGILEAVERNQHLDPPTDVDALAWYLPFHYFGLDWGIYVKESAVFELAARIYADMRAPRLTPRLVEDLCRMGLSILYLHEAFHHKVESFATRLEIAARTPVYRAYKDTVIKSVRGTDAHLEEAVACAEMLTRLGENAYRKGVVKRTHHAAKNFVEDWIPLLDPGYRLGLEHVGEESRWQLQAQIAEATPRPARSHRDWGLADNMLRGFFDKDAVARVIVPIGTRPVIPWLNGADPLVSISTDRLAKFVRREFGYVEVPNRGKGSHRWFECPTGEFPAFPLPAKRESLSPGVLKTVASALGLQSIRDLAQRC